jgi:hypothetical protein
MPPGIETLEGTEGVSPMNDGYIIGPIGVPGSQVTVNTPGGGAVTGNVGANNTVYIGGQPYQISRA